MRLVLDVAALSNDLTDILVSRITLLDVLAEGAAPGAPPAPDPRDPGYPAALRRWYEENLLFIHCQHPMLHDGPKIIGLLLSRVVDQALAALYARGVPDGLDLAIVAAGSLGSWGLSFGSDLDLLAVTRDEAGLQRATEAVRRIIEEARRSGLPAIDLRLRGEGASAPIVQTVDYTERYLEQRADPWEMIAYAKCRFLCGDKGTGEAFDEMLGRSLGRLFMREGWRERTREARAKLESLAKSPWDVKHAAGGLYDIDFIRSVRALTGRDGLAEGEPFEIEKAHQLYRMIEHSAALHGYSYPPLPEREAFFERYFSRLFGERVRGEGPFLDRLHAIKRNVRGMYERFFEKMQ